MRKNLFFLLLPLLFLAGCSLTAKPATTPPTSPEQPAATGEDSKLDAEQHSLICSHLCSRTIPQLCESEISDAQEQGLSLDERIYDEASCLLYCEADWDETTFACVSDASDCAQLSEQGPYCIDNDGSKEPDDSASVTPKGCFNACKRYSDCARYTEGVGPQDIQDAFDSCMEICPTWTKESRDCIASTPISKPSDCAAQTACILPAVKEMMNR